ncbi:helicase-exonuclease AddAB subunit AddB [Bacillus taeanensis]|uniref:ATP-dependent helicase/deoxyribonuclease subunit B n=1 Tax=Bacillus taeanensis TaxID=273032 RepID=A0A366XWS4_9BACI|nr:helicase-exonuclease AddAB subunit AddB [Bacillus taeanensis]RBW69219.1 helicase-exonuclease AddAB subunit AddB [Bacillus taeanensis]
MSLRFILGRAGSGKSTFCLDEIREHLINNPNGSPLLYLVPEQMTFQSEYALITTPNLGGMIRAQVFSMSRLAWRILQETGGYTRTHLTAVGTNMMLRKIIERKRNELKVFQRASDKTGFVDKLSSMVTEFKRYCISPEQLMNDQEISNHFQNYVLQEKLHDLAMIYGEFENELLGKYVDGEDMLQLLAEKISSSAYLKKAEIWIDGFHSFTPQEFIVVEQLMKHCKRVTVALTMDEPYDFHPPHELALFHETGTTYRTLLELSKQHNIEVETLEILRRPYPRFRHASLAHLEEYFESRPAEVYREGAEITISSAVNRRAEIEGAARSILALVRNSHYRFRDIAVMTRNMENYHELMKTIFNDYHIPTFFDTKRTMLHHPVIELIRSSLEVIKGNWRYEAVFRFLKTDLLFPVDDFDELENWREQMDLLENHVLEAGIHGKRWKDEQAWEIRRFYQLEDDKPISSEELSEKEKHLNELRIMVVNPLSMFETKIKQAKTSRQKAAAVYHLLDHLKVAEKLENWREQAEIKGDLETAREHDQVWKAVINLLDEIVEIVGEEQLSLEMFSKMVESGMESLRFSLVPPSLDQVLVGTIDRTRFSKVKCAFLIGVNEGVLPAKPEDDGMLTEEEREEMSGAGIQLASGSRRKLLDEQFYIYGALTTPSEQLHVSYSLSDEEGKAMFPSILINRLKELFPMIEEQLIFGEPEGREGEMSFITNEQKSLSFLAGQLRNWKHGYGMKTYWWDVYNWFVEHDADGKAHRLLSSLFYKNNPQTLTKETSRKLYGKRVKASVSRMEKFSACPFSQFASHGLRLKQRAVFRLEAPDIGQLFHSALGMITEHIRQSNMDWKKLSKEQCQELADQMVDQLTPKLQSQILLSSNRHHYITRKLKDVVGRAASILGKQAQKSGYSPIGIEVPFGPNAKLPPITFTLSNGIVLEVIGRIDRVDQANSSQGIMLRIIDYKSSAKDLNLTEVYYGLALQMLTYLDVLITHAPKWLGDAALPAGVLYFHVHNPMIQVKNVLSSKKIEEELFKKYKMKGLVLADQENVQLMDADISNQSNIIPAGIKKDGTFSKSSSIASKEELTAIREHVHDLIKNIGQQMTEGSIHIAPYKLKDKTPCTYCVYKSVCQFDQALEDNNFRVLKAEKDEVVLKKIREERRDNDE